MLRKTHMNIGLASGFVSGVLSINFLLNPTLMMTTWINSLVIILASTLPDIDVKLNIKHRGFTHSILFGIILSIFIFFIYPSILPAFLLGFYLHLAADMFTNSGIQLFYPSKKKIGFHVMGFNDPTEIIIRVCCWIIIALLFWKQVPIDIKSFILNML